MTEHIEQTVQHLQEKLRQQIDEANQTRRLINLLCRTSGREPIYPDADEAIDMGGTFRRDQFYGRALATVIKEVLQAGRATKGAQTVNEIYDKLKQGGYRFETKNDANAKRSLQISLTKNPAFHRIPSGAWGLKEWYPNIREKASGDDEDRSADSIGHDAPPPIAKKKKVWTKKIRPRSEPTVEIGDEDENEEG